MTAKQYLQQVYRLDNQVNAKLEQVSMHRALATKVTSVFSDERVSRSRQHSKVEDGACKLADLEREINADIDRLVDLKREVAVTIDSVENSDYRLLLTLRYLNFKTWEQIAVEMNYGWRNIHYMHNNALRVINFA